MMQDPAHPAETGASTMQNPAHPADPGDSTMQNPAHPAEPGASGHCKPGPIVLPAVALALAIVSFCFGAASNVLSRQVEARADAFSLRLTRDPAAFLQLERRLALRNVSDPDPPALLHALFGTHPTTIERIGIGEAFNRAG